MQTIPKPALAQRPPAATGDFHPITCQIASALSRILLTPVRDPAQWLQLVADSITGCEAGAPTTGFCPVSRAAIAISDAESPSWRVQSVAASGTGPVADIGHGNGTAGMLDGDGLGGVPVSLPGVQGCMTRREAIPDSQWANHPIRALRAQLGLDDFVRIALSIGGHSRAERLVVQLDQRLGSPWAEPDMVEFLSILGPHLVQAYSTQVMQPRARRQSLLERVSPVQRQIVSMLVEGKTERDIAKVLSRSPHTVHDHVKTIYAVLGISSRFQLIDKWSGGAVTGELNGTATHAHGA